MTQRTPTPGLEDLRQLVADTLELPTSDITDEADFVQDLDVDSLITLEIATRLEDQFGVEVGDEELKAVSTLIGVHELVTRKLAVA